MKIKAADIQVGMIHVDGFHVTSIPRETNHCIWITWDNSTPRQYKKDTLIDVMHQEFVTKIVETQPKENVPYPLMSFIPKQINEIIMINSNHFSMVLTQNQGPKLFKNNNPGLDPSGRPLECLIMFEDNEVQFAKYVLPINDYYTNAARDLVNFYMTQKEPYAPKVLIINQPLSENYPHWKGTSIQTLDILSSRIIRAPTYHQYNMYRIYEEFDFIETFISDVIHPNVELEELNLVLDNYYKKGGETYAIKRYSGKETKN